MDHDRHAVAQRRRRSPRFPPGLSPPRRAPRAAAVLSLVAAIVAGGCEMPRLPELPSLPELPAIPGVYRIDIQQGNIVDGESLDQLEIGMERRKVSFILGTPLLVDPFHQDRWDYYYSLRPGSGAVQRQHITLHFVDDRLARIENRLQPEVAPDTQAERTRTLVKVPDRRRREGIFERLVPDFLKGDDAP